MKKDDNGFILLELIVALTVLGIGFSVLFASMAGSTRNIDRLEKFEHRRQLAENLLAELDLVQRLKAGDTAHGAFDDGTRWRIEVEPFARSVQTGDGLVRIQLHLEWQGNSGPQMRTIETYRLEKNRTMATLSLDAQLHDLQLQN
jgi:prepilin-type N-terminal cleavage/methylation domain-containing protein